MNNSRLCGISFYYISPLFLSWSLLPPQGLFSLYWSIPDLLRVCSLIFMRWWKDSFMLSKLSRYILLSALSDFIMLWGKLDATVPRMSTVWSIDHLSRSPAYNNSIQSFGELLSTIVFGDYRPGVRRFTVASRLDFLFFVLRKIELFYAKRIGLLSFEKLCTFLKICSPSIRKLNNKCLFPLCDERVECAKLHCYARLIVDFFYFSTQYSNTD